MPATDAAPILIDVIVALSCVDVPTELVDEPINSFEILYVVRFHTPSHVILLDAKTPPAAGPQPPAVVSG